MFVFNLIIRLNRLKVLVLGVTFKENCPDYRNTKVVNVISKLKLNGLKVDAYDPWVNTKSFYQDHNLVVYDHIPNTKYNAIILAVSHDSFRKIDLNKIKADNNTVIYDIKGFFNKNLVTKRL